MRKRPIDDDDPQVLACGADDADRRYFRVEVTSGGERRFILIALDAFTEAPDRIMAQVLGLLTTVKKNAFREILQTALRELQPTFRVIARPGLSLEHYVLPCGSVVGPQPYPEVCLSAPHENVERRLRAAGGPACLQVAELAVGNPRLMLALSVGLCGPVLELLQDLELPFIQLLGQPGGGKTTIARMTNSIWGAPQPYPWSDTINCIERLADGLSGTVLVLDELGTFPWEQARSQEAFRGGVMRLFSGEGRGRLGEGADHWRLGILSTSNISVRTLAAERFGRDERALHEAMCSRILEVPDPVGGYGVFEDLHGFATVEVLVAHLQEIIGANHGVMGPAFVRRMLRLPRKELLHLLQGWRDRYIRESRRQANVDPDTNVAARVTQIFATIYAAGCLAVHLGLLTWEVPAFGRAILSCEDAHRDLARRSAPSGRLRTDDPLDAIRHYCRAETGRRIVDLRAGRRDRMAGGDLDAGFLIRGPDGRDEFFISSWGLERICGSKARENSLKRQVSELDRSFGGESRYSMRRPIFRGQPRSNGIAIPLALLDIQEEGGMTESARSLLLEAN